MKYVLIDGLIRDFRGRIFMRDVPLDITDKGTLEAIAKSPYFKRVEDNVEAPKQRPVLSVRGRK